MWRVISYSVLFPLLGLTWCAVVMRIPYQSADIVELMETLPVNMTLTSLLTALVRVTILNQAPHLADASYNNVSRNSEKNPIKAECCHKH